MPLAPAAATVDSTRLGAVHRRLFDLVSGLPRESRDLLATSLLPAGREARVPAERCRNDFYWLLFPEWLATDGEAILGDLLWAQYCVYALLRMQDDAIDDDGDPHLTVAANHLALAAGSALRPHFGGNSPIWAWFDESIATTSDALVAIDRRQAHAQRRGEDDLAEFARLSRCLTLAMRAVLLRLNRDSEWPRWLAIFDHLAIASQILDDFHDMRDDLIAGRLNYAARHLSQPVLTASVEATEAVIASNIATSDRLRSLFDRVRAHLGSAAETLEAGDDPRFARYLGRYRRTVDRLESTVVRRRIRLLGAPDAPSGPADASYTST